MLLDLRLVLCSLNPYNISKLGTILQDEIYGRLVGLVVEKYFHLQKAPAYCEFRTKQMFDFLPSVFSNKVDLGLVLQNLFGINLLTSFCKLYRFIIAHYFSQYTEMAKLKKRVRKFTPKFLQAIGSRLTCIVPNREY